MFYLIVSLSAVLITGGCVAFFILLKRLRIHDFPHHADSHELLDNALPQSEEKSAVELEKVLKKKEEELEVLRTRLRECEKDLTEKSKQLDDASAQNQYLVTMLHRLDMSVKAADVMEKFREAVNGKCKIEVTEWKELYLAVSQLYPEFNKGLMQFNDTQDEEHLHAFYLLQAGFQPKEVLRLVKCSRTTFWRLKRQYEELSEQTVKENGEVAVSMEYA